MNNLNTLAVAIIVLFALMLLAALITGKHKMGMIDCLTIAAAAAAIYAYHIGII